MYAGRTSVSVVLVELQMPTDNITSSKLPKPLIQYSQFQVGVILGSVYAGLLPSSFIGGYLAYRYSAMWVVLASVGISSIIHSVAPVMFQRFETAVTQRVLAGLAEGLCEPAVYGALNEYMLPKQNARVAPFIFAACLSVSGCLFVAAFTSNPIVAACFVAVGFGCSAARAAVADANAFDIAPRYASVISGICRVTCRIVGLTFPLLVTALTLHKTLQEWSRVVLIKACVFATTGLIFLVSGSGEQQSWAAVPLQGQDGDETQQHGSKIGDEKKPLVLK
uniref:Major facilitator superfamily (MFS) profile domain-containing protein n=1 Tax=Branchiostoma floridae TaxID=7739 RepID=C3YM86_BRAFL|eukprot:XP_002602668.1 hypothetical protein BRAFLDRAFT_72964 [Branchiostoma floridae]